jgi:hydrogenase-4 component B
MNSIQLLMLSILFYCASALAVLLIGSARTGRQVSGLFSLLGALVGAVAAGMALFSGATTTLPLFQINPFGWMTLQLDGLSALLVGVIAFISVGTSLYSFSNPQGNRVVEFFTNLFIASMLVVVTVSNGFFFLLFWELMTLASYFLVIWETQKEESIRTGYIYMLVAHVGAVLIMLAFLVLFQKTGSFDFTIWRQAWIDPGVKSLVFLLVFFGFGAKAGMVPLHFWTPGAYSAAPDHVSALMSGVMKKTAIYGILRLSVDLMGVQDSWWGLTVLAFGALSAVFGAFYALAERDLKRLLAYSSVENVGIILMGIGVGMAGLAVQQPILAGLGFLAALYHVLNHAFFKSLLFLGTGAVISQTGTQNLNQLGGLGRRMPWTAFTFLTAALAIAAVPPFNGFVSEWFTYQSFFTASQIPLSWMRVFAPMAAVLLALAGALAVMVYIKAYGGAFTGPAHSQTAAEAHEAPRAVRFALLYLALGCLLLGVGAPLIAPRIAAVATGMARVPSLAVSNGWQVFPGQPVQAVLSPPLVLILLLGLLALPWLLAAFFGGLRAGRRSNVDPWSCGYGYSPVMSVSASSFDQPVKVSFNLLYHLRTLADKPLHSLANFSGLALTWIRRAEPIVELVVTRPTIRLVETAGQWIQSLQMGDIRVYCLYIILTLAILLIFTFGRSGL